MHFIVTKKYFSDFSWFVALLRNSVASTEAERSIMHLHIEGSAMAFSEYQKQTGFFRSTPKKNPRRNVDSMS